MALAWETHGLSVLAIVVIPVLTWSWLQDWISCEIAATYHEAGLAPFDILTACNYIALARGLERPADDWRLSPLASSHWAAIFVIYIVWNLWIARDSDGATRKMLVTFSVAELAPLAIAGWLWLGSDSAATGLYVAAVAMLMLMHASLLLAWRRRSNSRP